MEQITYIDFTEIMKGLNVEEVTRVFCRLGMDLSDIQNAHHEIRDPVLKGWLTFNAWKMRSGNKVTRASLIEAKNTEFGGTSDKTTLWPSYGEPSISSPKKRKMDDERRISQQIPNNGPDLSDESRRQRCISNSEDEPNSKLDSSMQSRNTFTEKRVLKTGDQNILFSGKLNSELKESDMLEGRTVRSVSDLTRNTSAELILKRDVLSDESINISGLSSQLNEKTTDAHSDQKHTPIKQRDGEQEEYYTKKIKHGDLVDNPLVADFDKTTGLIEELEKCNIPANGMGGVDIGDLLKIFASYNQQSKQQDSNKTFNSTAVIDKSFYELLKELGLQEYYCTKISLLYAICIRETTEDPKPIDISRMFIQRLLMLDYRSRDHLFKIEKNDTDALYHLYENGNSNKSKGALQPNSLDILVAIFVCCDSFLKQTLAEKMFACKLAIPFMYPLGSKGINMMSLWALRTIKIQWHFGIETPVTEKPLPMVTFVRLGRPPISKSKLINSILSDESHDTFYNHDCCNGNVPRRVTDGLVECSWLITAGKKKEKLPRTSMILNLRGDASLSEKQMQILKEISSIFFVIVTCKDLSRSPNSTTCRQILQSNAKVILFLISENNIKERRACIEVIGRDHFKCAKIMTSFDPRGKRRTANELRTSATSLLSKVISDGCSDMDIEECARLSMKMGIIVDEYDDKHCIEGKTLAEKTYAHIKGKSIAECKRLSLPLQGTEWIKYCKLVKREHRVSGTNLQSSSVSKTDQIKYEMDRLREKQVEKCLKTGLTSFTADFLQNLKQNTCLVLYYLKWLGMYLDEISRLNVQDIHESWCEQINEVVEDQKKKQIDHLKYEVQHTAKDFISTELGLEHLFRELGQIYESVKESSIIAVKTKTIVEYLPEIAAELLIKGHPLELVDGDRSSVPLVWIGAVLKKLGEMIGTKKLFVISVLGIQSSGKSTLLNTMFGLQFPVSTGKATRGVNMQLIPVDHATLSFDYIVVLDTEGIRGPELAQTKYDHDNELATLVIGLGDVTIINVKGENTFEIRDILQTAVHAFLRMNIVMRHTKYDKTCIFAHQNVSAVNAEIILSPASRKLLETLDSMVKEAVNSENITDIHCFSQIINFDVKQHVWYFSDLWLGDPPMAPANPGYSEKAQAVKLSILEEVASRKTTFLTTTDLLNRLSDLWKGVIADDFVFSFRNSLAVKAFNTLQSKYHDLEFELHSDLKFWLNETERRLQKIEITDKLDNVYESLVIELSQVLNETAENVKTRLKDFFNTSNLQGIVIQWQQSKMNQLVLAIEQQRIECKADLLSIKEARRVEILQSQIWSNMEERIMTTAAKLAENLKGDDMTEVERQVFETMWSEMVNDFAIPGDDKELKMDLLMEEILYDKFHSHRRILRRKLELSPLINLPRQKSLEESITVNDVESSDIGLLSSWSKYYDTEEKAQLQARKSTVELLCNILHEISSYLQVLQSHTDVKFQKANAIEVIEAITEKVDSHNHNEYFKIQPACVVKFAVHVSRFCVDVFRRMQSNYIRNYGVKTKLQNYKSSALNVFKNVLKETASHCK